MSYSSEKKSQLAQQQIKRNCCRKALLYGLLYPYNDFEEKIINYTTDSKTARDLVMLMLDQCFGKKAIFSKREQRDDGGYALLGFEGDESYVEAAGDICDEYLSDTCPSKKVFACESCRVNFMKGIFISCGRISDPEKSLHLEFVFPCRKSGEMMKEYMNDIGLSPKQINRKENYALYFKKQEEIEDFLATMGDSQGAMQIMNIAIMRSLRNNANRYSNCDAANLYKATEAASAQIQAINKLDEQGRLKTLTEDLQITAKLRVEHPELTLAQLGEIHTPPISKSGVNHRLKKLLALAEE